MLRLDQLARTDQSGGTDQSVWGTDRAWELQVQARELQIQPGSSKSLTGSYGLLRARALTGSRGLLQAQALGGSLTTDQPSKETSLNPNPPVNASLSLTE